jgi:gliding motility-associated-like protein
LNYTVNGQSSNTYHLPSVFKIVDYDDTNENQAELSYITGNTYLAYVEAGEAGNFEFALISVEDANCINNTADTVDVEVWQKPVATLRETTICANDSIRIDLTGKAPFDGFILTLANGSKQYTAPNIGSLDTNYIAIAIDSINDTGTEGVPGGAYVCKISYVDSNGCSNDGEAEIPVIIIPRPTVSITDTVTCLDDGVEITFTGTPPFTLVYTVNGNNPSTVGLVSPLVVHGTDTTIIAGSAGDFTFGLTSLTDSAGCINTLSQEINITVYHPTVSMADDTICFGDSAKIVVTGIAPFDIKFSTTRNGSPTGTFNRHVELSEVNSNGEVFIGSADTGTYVFTLISIEDANCINTALSASATIRVNPLPTVSMADDTICYGDSAKIVVTGTAPFDIKFSTTRNGTTTGTFNRHVEAGEINANGEVFIGSADTGTYVFTLLSIEDANCINTALSASATVRVNALPTVTVDVPSNDLCKGEEINLHFTGASPFTLEYTVDGNNPNTVGLVSPLVVHGTDTAIIAGSAGTFKFEFVSLTDDNTCMGTSNVADFTVTVNDLPAKPTITVNADSVCLGATLIFTAPSGYTQYEWIEIKETTNDTVVTISDTTGKTATGEYRYIVRVQNSHGCWSEYSDTVTGTINVLPAKPTINSVSNVCFGETLTFKTKPDYNSYYWIETITGDITIKTDSIMTVTAAGTYKYVVRVQNSHGCWSAYSDTVTGTINVLPAKPTITPVSNVCFGDSIVFKTASGFISYEWTENITGAVTAISDTMIKVLSVGQYSYKVRVQDANGCWSAYSDIVNGEIYALPETPVIGNVSNVCYGETLTFATTSGYVQYEWVETTGNGTVINASNTAVQTAAGSYTYKVRVQNANGCWSEFSNEVSGEIYAVPSKPVIGAVVNVCYGGTLTFTTAAAGVVQYEWTETLGGAVVTNTSNTISQTNAGTYAYTLRVQNANGCWSGYSDTVSGEIYPSFVMPVISPSEISICADDEVTLAATSGFAIYAWYHNGNLVETSVSNTYTANEAGIYTVEVETNDGCESGISEGAIIEIIPYPTKPVIKADGLSDSVVWRKTGMNIVFEVSNKVDALIYQWYHNGTMIAGGQGEALNLASLILNDAGIYTVTATTQKAQCTTESDIVKLIMRSDVFIPRLITPNNDGENDNLTIRGLEIYPHNELIVINRWGNEVFRSKDYVNGTWKGDNLPDGAYFYKLRLIESNGYTEEKTGYFHLKR